MKLTKIAAVMALAAAGVANAAVNTTLGNAEIFLSAYDDAHSFSYIYDTGLNVSSLIDGSINASINIGADANWATFVSKVGGVANINWGVSAVQNAAGKNNKFIYSTLNSADTIGTLAANSFMNTRLNPEITALTNVTAGVSLPGSSVASSIEAAGTAGYIGENFDVLNTVVAGVDRLTNKLDTGDHSFIGVANSNTSSNVAKVTLFPTSAAVASFNTTSGSAVLTITAVPEPTTNALALAALAGFGFVARRRSSK